MILLNYDHVFTDCTFKYLNDTTWVPFRFSVGLLLYSFELRPHVTTGTAERIIWRMASCGRQSDNHLNLNVGGALTKGSLSEASSR